MKKMTGDDALTILTDVGNDIPPGKSRLRYTSEMLAFRREVEEEFGKSEYVMDVPSELPREDIVVNLKEADDDDGHFYGAWKKGGKVSGGTMAKAKASQRRRSRRRRSGVASQALVQQAKEAGFTVPAFGGRTPTEGYMLSIYPNQEQVVPVSEFGKASVEDFIDGNADLLAKENHFLGGWRDGDSIYLDISVNEKDRAAAEALAREHNQLAMWDLQAGGEVRFDEADAKQMRRCLLDVKTATEEDVDAFVAYLLGDDEDDDEQRSE